MLAAPGRHRCRPWNGWAVQAKGLDQGSVSDNSDEDRVPLLSAALGEQEGLSSTSCRGPSELDGIIMILQGEMTFPTRVTNSPQFAWTSWVLARNVSHAGNPLSPSSRVTDYLVVSWALNFRPFHSSTSASSGTWNCSLRAAWEPLWVLTPFCKACNHIFNPYHVPRRRKSCHLHLMEEDPRLVING